MSYPFIGRLRGERSIPTSHEVNVGSVGGRVVCTCFILMPSVIDLRLTLRFAFLSGPVMTADILDPSAILGLLPSLLPPAEKSLVSPQDAIAALVHSALTALSFRLVIDQGSPLSTSESNVLPVEWNKNGPAHYSFKYRHEQSSLDFLINVSKLGTRDRKSVV